MSFTLSGLRELARSIEVERMNVRRNMDRAIQREIEYLGAKIKARLGDLGAYVQIDLTEKSISLRYQIGTSPKGKVLHTARDYHNPASRRFNFTGQRQPFQDVLAEEGYIDISPGPGVPIPISHGEAPNVRITATMGPDAISRMQKFMEGP